MCWTDICAVDDIPVLGSRVVRRASGGDIAIFRNSENRVFALLDRCPHKGGPLSQGIVFGERVACPLHNWSIELSSGCALAPDEGCTQRFAVRVGQGRVHLEAAALVDEGQAQLGTGSRGLHRESLALAAAEPDPN
jgi:nitrite reductase (NADH) small subunit